MDFGNSVLHFSEELVDDLWLLLVNGSEPSGLNLLDNWGQVVSGKRGSSSVVLNGSFLDGLDLGMKLREELVISLDDRLSSSRGLQLNILVVSWGNLDGLSIGD